MVLQDLIIIHHLVNPLSSELEDEVMPIRKDRLSKDGSAPIVSSSSTTTATTSLLRPSGAAATTSAAHLNKTNAVDVKKAKGFLPQTASRSKVGNDNYAQTATSLREKDKERGGLDRNKSFKTSSKMALKLKEREKEKEEYKRPSFSAVIAPASAFIQGSRPSMSSANIPSQRIDTTSDRTTPREVSTGFKRTESRLSAFSSSSSSYPNAKDSVRDHGASSSSIHNINSRVPLKNPQLQEEYKAQRLKAKQDEAERLKAEEDIRKDKANFSKTVDDVKMKNKIKELVSSRPNNVVMIQKFGSLNEEVFTCISQVWGSNRNLLNRWETSSTIPGLFWEYLVSATDFKNRGFNININLSSIDKIQIFGLDPLEADSSGAALLRHIVDSSYAVFCGQSPSSFVDVVMIVNSQGLAGVSICEQLGAMNIYSDAGYYLVAFSKNSLFAPPPQAVIPPPVVVPVPIISHKPQGPPPAIRGSGNFMDPQIMIPPPIQYNTNLAPPQYQMPGMPYNTNNVPLQYQMPGMPYNTNHDPPQYQMPGMPYNTSHAPPQYQMPGMPYNTNNVPLQYQMPGMPYNTNNVLPQYQMPGMPYNSHFLHPVTQINESAAYPETTAQYLRDVSNSISNSVSADKFQNSFRVTQPTSSNHEGRETSAKSKKAKKREKGKEKGKERDKEREKERERIYKPSASFDSEGTAQNFISSSSSSSSRIKDKDKDYRGGRNSEYYAASGGNDIGKDRGVAEVTLSKHQPGPRDYPDRLSLSMGGDRAFSRSNSSSRDIRERDIVRSKDSSIREEYIAGGRRRSDPSVYSANSISMDIGVVYTGDDPILPLTASTVNGVKKRRHADVEDNEEMETFNPYRNNNSNNDDKNGKKRNNGDSSNNNNNNNNNDNNNKTTTGRSNSNVGVKKSNNKGDKSAYVNYAQQCHFYAKGTCNKGNKCPRLHGTLPHPSN